MTKSTPSNHPGPGYVPGHGEVSPGVRRTGQELFPALERLTSATHAADILVVSARTHPTLWHL